MYGVIRFYHVMVCKYLWLSLQLQNVKFLTETPSVISFNYCCWLHDLIYYNLMLFCLDSGSKQLIWQQDCSYLLLSFKITTGTISSQMAIIIVLISKQLRERLDISSKIFHQNHSHLESVNALSYCFLFTVLL